MNIMQYCKECGAEVSDGALYCPTCGAEVGYRHSFMLASWGDRVLAYIIDTLVVGAISSILFPFSMGVSSAFLNLGSRSVLYFFYWTFMEGMYGQSLGKMALKIEVAHIDGGSIDYGTAAIQAVGKAFLLPIDLILGWFLSPKMDQRFFNKISDTVVVKKRV